MTITQNNKQEMTSNNQKRIKIISMNVKGLKGEGKRRKVLKWARKKKFDIMTMQESHFEDKDKNDWKEIWDGTILYSSGTNRSKGVLTLINKNTEHEVIEEHKDTEGRWTVTKLRIFNLKLTLANFYGPNDDEPIHLKNMLEKIEEIESEKIIIVGDFNFIQNVNLDKFGGQKKTNFKCQKVGLEWMAANNISDIWRIKNPYCRKYTWISNTTPKIMSRLDYFLLSDNLQGNYENTDIIPGFMTDHSCITLTIKINEEQRGRGFWKFNSTLTNNKQLKDQINKIINQTVAENQEADDCVIWDLIKCKIRGECIGISSAINKEKREEFANLEQEIRELENILQEQIINNMNTFKTEEDLEKKKRARHNLIAEKTRGDIIRSKCKWHDEGHSASKMFLNLEKSKGEAKTIRRLKTEILQEEEKFYKELYTSNKEKSNYQKRQIEQEIWNTEGKTLEEEDHETLTEPITEEEIYKIIQDSPNNKSPGTDGLTNEFYKEYWPIVKKFLINSFNFGLQRGKLNISQRRSVITLIPKPQKDLENLKNWRPISLLNQDYKYLTKLLAKRLDQVLQKIISTDQSGFVKNRYIGCNIQRLQNLMEMTEKDKIQGIITNIDFEKAFDTLEWNFIIKCLKKLNFPDKYINWIRSIYTEIETCIINNGYTSKFFKPERGVRQGCPISPYLFIITTELLNRWLKIRMKEEGIKDKNGKEYLITQFADDTSFALDNSKKPLKKLFDLLTEYGEISGLKINLSKTEILPIGITKNEEISYRYRKNIRESLQYLGCSIFACPIKTTEENFEEAVKKLKNIANKWINRKTTLSGKIAVIKSLLLPQLTYILSITASPKEEKIKEINRIFYDFINSGGTEKIKRNILIGNYDTGGYKMVDLESYIKSIKINWVIRLLKIDGIWKEEIKRKCKTEIEYLLRCNLKKKDFPIKSGKNTMWEEIWTKWCEENYREPETIEEILNENIWYNSDIKIGNKVVFWKNWYEQDIKRIGDLVVADNQGNMRIWTFNEIRELGIENLNIMNYNSIISAIPREWKRKISQTNVNSLEEDVESKKLLDILIDQKKPMRKIYNSLINRKKEKPNNAIEKWRRDLEEEIEENSILTSHRKNHWCTINHKLRSYNCNYMNRNIYSNRKLFIIGKINSEKCNHCEHPREDIMHMYWSCKEKEKLWIAIQNTYQDITGKILKIEEKKCMLGIFQEKLLKEDEERERLLFLLVRHYIHLNKCNEDNTPSELGLNNYIKNYLKIEMELSKQKKTLHKFRRLWENWIPWLE
jgi:hypothetical protein